MHETEKLVKNVVVQLVGVIVKHELPRNGWPEVMQFVQHLLTSGNTAQQEVSVMMNIKYILGIFKLFN